MTLKTLPLVTSPTGTEIGAPVSVTSWPRTRPSVGLQRDGANQVVAEVLGDLERQVLRQLVRASMVVVSALYIAGIESCGELDVDDRAGDAEMRPRRVVGSLCGFSCRGRCHWFSPAVGA